jgi:predicted lipid-binding transport protein (Tim44 family)
MTLHRITRHIGNEMLQAVTQLDEVAAAEDRLLDGFDHAIHDQPAAVADGVDIGPIKAVDPEFDPFAFRTSARESFLKIREARARKLKSEEDPLLSPTMQAELDSVIDGDVASHRHHYLADLAIDQATVVSAEVADGRERLGMRFVIVAEEEARDDATQSIVGGDEVARRWAELWQFERDPAVDSTATDEQHALSFGPDGWLFAHRGWVVTAITRLPDVLAEPAQPPRP